MKRRLFTIFWALSLLPFVAVVALWVRSHHVADNLGWHCEFDEPERWGERDTSIVSSGGGLRYSRYEIVDTDAPEWLRRLPGAVSFEGPPIEEKPVGFRWRTAREVAYPYTGNTYLSRRGNTTLGFGASRIMNESTEGLGEAERVQQSLIEVVVPYWSLALACLFPLMMPILVAVLRTRRRRRREARHQCPSCGYDLRATPGRCPECGHCDEELSRPAQPCACCEQVQYAGVEGKWKGTVCHGGSGIIEWFSGGCVPPVRQPCVGRGRCGRRTRGGRDECGRARRWVGEI
jgi:hypothetical protein